MESHYPKQPGASPSGDGGEQVPAVKKACGLELMLVWGAAAIGCGLVWLAVSAFLR